MVVASQHTLQALREIVAAGWTGPVLVVGTVDEAVQVVEANPTEDQPAPAPAPAAAAAYPQQVRPVVRPEPRPVRLDLTLDRNRQLLVSRGGECALTPLEFGVLEALAEHPGQVRRFEDLSRRVWGSAHVGDCGQMHAVIRRVRRKLELVAAPVDLLAVRGVGFRLVAHPVLSSPRLMVAE